MRKLVSIVTIATADPIPETDRLDVVTIAGKAWRIVTGRNEFRPGDRAVYFEIGSALPAAAERFAFLHDRCLRSWSDKHGNVLKKAVRIRTVKLRGVISQGLVMPIGIFPELADLQSGDDATELLKVEHFDEISEEMCAALDTRCPQGFGRREGNFPAFSPKTDEERIQNLADWPEQLKAWRGRSGFRTGARSGSWRRRRGCRRCAGRAPRRPRRWRSRWRVRPGSRCPVPCSRGSAWSRRGRRPLTRRGGWSPTCAAGACSGRRRSSPGPRTARPCCAR